MKKKLYFILPTIAIILLFVVLTSKFLISAVQISGNSMFPTFSDRQIVFFEKVAYISKEPNRGDIVILSFPTEENYIIKRIVGLPGDTISFDEYGEIYINGTVFGEPYRYGNAIDNLLGKATETTIITLDNDEYFVLGDNRANSYDSRQPEMPKVTKKNIIGKVLFADIGLKYKN